MPPSMSILQNKVAFRRNHGEMQIINLIEKKTCKKPNTHLAKEGID
jgi:hypothetical protein